MEKQITLVEARNYLIKGCAPQIYREGDEFPIDQEGPVNQRRWKFTDETNHIFRTQRHKGFGRLALVQPALVGDNLILRAAGMPDCTVPCDESGEQITTTIWDADVPVTVHADASKWISDFMKKKLLFVQQAGDRPVNSIYAPEDATVGFADRFPLTAVSKETIEKSKHAALPSTVDGNRYRYNLLFAGCEAQDENRMARFRIGSFVGRAAKPCGRCNTININQETGVEDVELFDILKNHPNFRNPHTGEPIISENMLVENPGVITIGSPVEVLEWSEYGWNRPYTTNHLRQKNIRGIWNTAKSLGIIGLWRKLRGKDG
ncbi:MAG: MOSC domain-containing protein [Candidatus Peregrinibacteria bacterium]|nr:MOSC domain-containing protein [Candidatus Peregrinibacteria bacterium]